MENVRTSASWQGIFKSLILFALLASATAAGYPATVLEDHCMGPAPINLEITDRSSGSISFAWDGVDSPDRFKVWYYRSQDNFTSTPVLTQDEFYTFSSLPNGTYDFFFVAIHGQEESNYIATVDLIM